MYLIMQAAETCDTSRQHGVNVNELDSSGQAPIHKVTKYGNVRAVEALLKQPKFGKSTCLSIKA